MSELKILGVIPARGGSKGIRRKNIRPLAGRMLLSYTVDAANKSELLSDIVVSTEDPEIAAAAKSLGVRTIERPAELAQDATPTCPVVQHALAAVEEQTAQFFGAVFTLQVTSPFRTAADIDASIRLLVSSGADSVIGVVRIYDSHPARVKQIVQGRLRPFCLPEHEDARRQDLAPAYLRNGAVYLTRRQVIDSGSLRGAEQCPYEMPAERSINIDEPLDFLLAEAALASGLVHPP